MNPTALYPLTSLSQDNLSQVPSSALVLGRLISHHLPVLPGFVIPSQYAYYFQDQGSLNQERIDQLFQSYSQLSPELNKTLLLTTLNAAHDPTIPTYDLADNESSLVDSLYRLWTVHPGSAILVQIIPDLQYSGIAIFQSGPNGIRNAHVWIHSGFWHPTQIAQAHKLVIDLESGQIISQDIRHSEFFSQIQGSTLVTRSTPDEFLLQQSDIESITNLVAEVNKYAHEFNFVHFVAPDVLSIQSLEQANFPDILALEQLYDKKKLPKPITRGIALSPGSVTAPLHYLAPNGMIDSSLEGAIVAAPTISVSQILAHPHGLITQTSHYTDALAIFARHYHIPLISVPDFLSFAYLIDGQTVVLDADQGSLSLPQDVATYDATLPKNKTEVIIQANNLFSDSRSSGTYMAISSIWSSLLGLNQDQIRANNYTLISARLCELLVSQALIQSPNPLIVYPQLFTNEYIDGELHALRAARKHVSNLHLCLPEIATLDQFKIAKKKLYYYGLKRSASFKFYISLTSPALAWHLSDLAADGLDGVVIDLDQLIPSLYGPTSHGDVHDPQVLQILETLIFQANNLRLDCYVVGDTVAYDPDIIQKMIKWGITGVIVTPDRVASIRQDIARNEINISKNKHRLNKRKR